MTKKLNKTIRQHFLISIFTLTFGIVFTLSFGSGAKAQQIWEIAPVGDDVPSKTHPLIGTPCTEDVYNIQRAILPLWFTTPWFPEGGLGENKVLLLATSSAGTPKPFHFGNGAVYISDTTGSVELIGEPLIESGAEHPVTGLKENRTWPTKINASESLYCLVSTGSNIDLVIENIELLSAGYGILNVGSQYFFNSFLSYDPLAAFGGWVGGANLTVKNAKIGVSPGTGVGIFVFAVGDVSIVVKGSEIYSQADDAFDVFCGRCNKLKITNNKLITENAPIFSANPLEIIEIYDSLDYTSNCAIDIKNNEMVSNFAAIGMAVFNVASPVTIKGNKITAQDFGMMLTSYAENCGVIKANEIRGSLLLGHGFGLFNGLNGEFGQAGAPNLHEYAANYVRGALIKNNTIYGTNSLVGIGFPDVSENIWAWASGPHPSIPNVSNNNIIVGNDLADCVPLESQVLLMSGVHSNLFKKNILGPGYEGEVADVILCLGSDNKFRKNQFFGAARYGIKLDGPASHNTFYLGDDDVFEDFTATEYHIFCGLETSDNTFYGDDLDELRIDDQGTDNSFLDDD